MNLQSIEEKLRSNWIFIAVIAVLIIALVVSWAHFKTSDDIWSNERINLELIQANNEKEIQRLVAQDSLRAIELTNLESENNRLERESENMNRRIRQLIGQINPIITNPTPDDEISNQDLVRELNNLIGERFRSSRSI